MSSPSATLAPGRAERPLMRAAPSFRNFMMVARDTSPNRAASSLSSRLPASPDPILIFMTEDHARGAGAQPLRSGGNQFLRLRPCPDAGRRLDRPEAGELADVARRRAARAVAGAGLEEVHALVHRDPRRAVPLRVVQQAGLENRLEHEVGDGRAHRRDVRGERRPVARLERTEVDDHVDFGGTVVARAGGAVRLVVHAIGTERKPGHRDDRDFRVAQRGDPVGLNANAEAAPSDGFGAGALDVALRSVGAEQGVLDGPRKRGAQRGYFFRSL